ncbi:MAG: MFS transporter [Promethearchaeota archaeon]
MQIREFVGLASFQFLVFFRRAVFFTFLTIYMFYELGVSATITSGMYFTSMLASSSCQSFLWGKISDKYQKRRTLIVGGEGIAAIAHFLMFFLHIWTYDNIGKLASGLALIVAMTILEGFWSASNVGWSALLSDLTDEVTRRKIIGPISGFGGLGSIVGAFLAAFLYDLPEEGAGFREGPIFFITALIIAFSAILVFFTLPEGGVTAAVVSEEQDNPPLSVSLPIPRTYWYLLIATFVYFAAIFSVFTVSFLYPKLESTFNASSLEIAFVRTAGAISLILIAPLITVMTDQLGLKWSFLLSSGITVLMLPIFTVAPTFEFYLMAILIQTGFQNASRQISYLIASEIIPKERRGRLFGYYNGLSFLSFGIGGILITGPIIDLVISLGSSEAVAFKAGFLSAFVWALVGIFLHAPILRIIDGRIREKINDTY